jgi:hypothetical protein
VGGVAPGVAPDSDPDVAVALLVPGVLLLLPVGCDGRVRAGIFGLPGSWTAAAARIACASSASTASGMRACETKGRKKISVHSSEKPRYMYNAVVHGFAVLERTVTCTLFLST